MKRIFSLLFLWLGFINIICSQKLQVESFKIAQSDLSAQVQPRKDLNDRNCALIKVQFVGTISEAEGNVVMPLVKRGNETWIYMPQGSRQLKLLTQNYLPVTITFSDYGIEKLESNRTYVLPLIKPNSYLEPVDAGGNFYVLKVQPKNAVLFIDGTLQANSSDGEYSAMLSYGTHTYKVEAGGYISKSGSFVVSSGEMSPINVNLVSAMASVTVTCPTPAVSLYVDKKSVGKVPWTGSIKDGMHLIEVRKEGYRSQQKTIQLLQRQKMDIAFGELIAIQGNLSVNYKPFGADIYVDGKKLGQSPRVFNGLLVGNHQVEIKKDGYTTDSKTVIISEGQTTSMMGALDEELILDENGNPVNRRSSTSLDEELILDENGNPVNRRASTSKINKYALLAESIKSVFINSSTSDNKYISISVKDGINIEMVKVEAGTFMMGATPKIKHPYDDEKPAHQVTLTKNYYIGKYEVTQALWKMVMNSNPSAISGDDRPVEQVSWHDCQEFIEKLNKITGRKFRLPTEAEWEYAARGGNKSHGYIYSGSNKLSTVAWFYDNNGCETKTVGTKQANELGIYDMTGNVWEWCQDWYATYHSSSQINPTGVTNGTRRVYRGAGYAIHARSCHISFRGCQPPTFRSSGVGLRLALTE